MLLSYRLDEGGFVIDLNVTERSTLRDPFQRLIDNVPSVNLLLVSLRESNSFHAYPYLGAFSVN
ncbi:hypothetical protein BCY86_02715 [Pajaroellobacter abortibovis]|uniref:Uncharacterized protein n=1 Tax=Pajaroellobacter abortibovis TaxID=1882918 RepID=A0A1L6MWA8_9BACT|nr:hypothetical protein BCY86_02715 [Pajaroellobacter abortibovis]